MLNISGFDGLFLQLVGFCKDLVVGSEGSGSEHYRYIGSMEDDGTGLGLTQPTGTHQDGQRRHFLTWQRESRGS